MTGLRPTYTVSFVAPGFLFTYSAIALLGVLLVLFLLFKKRKQSRNSQLLYDANARQEIARSLGPADADQIVRLSGRSVRTDVLDRQSDLQRNEEIAALGRRSTQLEAAALGDGDITAADVVAGRASVSSYVGADITETRQRFSQVLLDNAKLREQENARRRSLGFAELDESNDHLLFQIGLKRHFLGTLLYCLLLAFILLWVLHLVIGLTITFYSPESGFSEWYANEVWDLKLCSASTLQTYEILASHNWVVKTPGDVVARVSPNLGSAEKGVVRAKLVPWCDVENGTTSPAYNFNQLAVIFLIYWVIAIVSLVFLAKYRREFRAWFLIRADFAECDEVLVLCESGEGAEVGLGGSATVLCELWGGGGGRKTVPRRGSGSGAVRERGGGGGRIWGLDD